MKESIWFFLPPSLSTLRFAEYSSILANLEFNIPIEAIFESQPFTTATIELTLHFSQKTSIICNPLYSLTSRFMISDPVCSICSSLFKFTFTIFGTTFILIQNHEKKFALHGSKLDSTKIFDCKHDNFKSLKKKKSIIC